MKLSALGLRARPPDLDSFIEDCEGELTSFLPRGLEKLHFLEGVLWGVVEVVGVLPFIEWCLEGVEKDGTSRETGGSSWDAYRGCSSLSEPGNVTLGAACC